MNLRPGLQRSAWWAHHFPNSFRALRSHRTLLSPQVLIFDKWFWGSSVSLVPRLQCTFQLSDWTFHLISSDGCGAGVHLAFRPPFKDVKVVPQTNVQCGDETGAELKRSLAWLRNTYFGTPEKEGEALVLPSLRTSTKPRRPFGVGHRAPQRQRSHPPWRILNPYLLKLQTSFVRPSLSLPVAIVPMPSPDPVTLAAWPMALRAAAATSSVVESPRLSTTNHCLAWTIQLPEVTFLSCRNQSLRRIPFVTRPHRGHWKTVC